MIYLEDLDSIKKYFKLIEKNEVKVTFLYDKYGFYPLQVALTLKNTDIT